MRVILRREADEELVEAARYYESQQPGLGQEFLTEAEGVFDQLARFPYQWRIVRKGVRRGLLRRFPYAFLYWERLPGEELEILAISHSKRHPLYWTHRFED